MNNFRELTAVVPKIVQWHYDKGIIDGATDQSQCFKMHEELIELHCACYPEATQSMLFRAFNANTARLYDQGKFAPITNDRAKEEVIDAVADMFVVGINILERNGISLETALNDVYDIISKRTGKVIDGSFVKDK